MAKHDKEACRYTDITKKEDIEQYASRKKEETWQLQWQQLQHTISKTFANFLKYIVNFNSLDRKYFLQSLKLGLNERSADISQPLYAAYEKCLLKEESEKKDTERKKLNKQLARSSLGLEHFFREMAVMYENMVALRKKIGEQESLLDSVLDTFTQTMADILLDGEAIEILDGDVAHSPVLWLTAVMNQIEEREAIRVFKVSALGAQSCGKSTLLNTLFGLNFPVSTGRCTRGAYMQLVKMDEQLAERLKCDYLLVIDSEGLMSRLFKSDDYDNELATFVIGLSDLTMVAVKGEGKEMGDILPIAIHVFLRMNVLGELQTCHFVHQFMGAVDVGKKMRTEIDAFVDMLDEKTWAAAEEAGQEKYKKFSHALHYDSKNDNTYLCGLWDGTPPMAKVDLEYSQTMQRLKVNILEEIWEAVKYENFVFSFRNVLEMETYKRLSKIFSDIQCEIKKNVRPHRDRLQKQIKDETLTNENFVVKIQNMKQEVEKNIVSSIQKLLSDILHYFKCPSCSKCSAEVRNRHFLKHYKGEFKRDIERFEITLKEENKQSAENFTEDVVASIHIKQLSSQMDTLIKKKVQELIEKMISQSESLTGEQMERSFEDLWKTVADEIWKKIGRKEKDTDIKGSVQSVITTNSPSTCDEEVFDLLASHLTRGDLTRLKERTKTELMQILRDHGGDVFRNVQALQASIMIDLLAKNTFEGYLRYITQYEEVIKEALTKRSIELLEDDNRLKQLAKSKLSTIIEELKQAIKKTDESPDKNFIGVLFSNMKGLKRPHNDIEAYKMITLDDKAKFASILINQLTSSILEQLEKDIDNWKVSNIIYKNGLTDFAFNEVVGCTATCPLCKVPCDAHSGGKTSGKHSAIFHRPRGLGRMVGTESRQLITYNCNEGVASDTAKRRTKTGQWIQLKKYRDMHPDWIIDPVLLQTVRCSGSECYEISMRDLHNITTLQ